MKKLSIRALGTLLTALAFAGVTNTTASAQIQTLDVQMADSAIGLDRVVLEPLTFARQGEIDPRVKVARKPFIGTLIFERDVTVFTREDGSRLVDTTTSSCAVTAAYDPEQLLNGIYDVRGFSADHCVSAEGEIGFDRALAVFPGAQKIYQLSPEDFTPSYQTSAEKAKYGFDWATVDLPEDESLRARPLHKGPYEGELIFEASTKGYVITSSGKKELRYVATTQRCQSARRHKDYSSDKVTKCRTAKAMSGGGFFIPETGALYATLSRIGEETGYSYATLISSVGQTYDPQYEYRFQVANYSLRGKVPFAKEKLDNFYQTASASTAESCRASDGSNIVDTLMMQGVPYHEARKVC